MDKVLKTITLMDKEENPIYSILEGHHDIETFNKAFAAEGWSGQPWPDDHISHEYWFKEGTTWYSTTKSDPRAKPYTVADWEGPTINKFRSDLH